MADNVSRAANRRVLAGDITLPSQFPRLVYGSPVFNAVSQLNADRVRVSLKIVYNSASKPAAAFVLQCLGEVEVVEGHEGDYARI